MLYPQVKVKVRSWLTKRDDNPMPMRVMVGYVTKETAKSVYVHLHGQPEPSSTCLHCNRELTHPVSIMYGIGPICGGHYHIPNVSMENVMDYYEEIRAKLAAVTWEGWLPRGHIVIEPTGEDEEVAANSWDITFVYQGIKYHVITNKPEKKVEILAKADKVLEVIPKVVGL